MRSLVLSLTLISAMTTVIIVIAIMSISRSASTSMREISVGKRYFSVKCFCFLLVEIFALCFYPPIQVHVVTIFVVVHSSATIFVAISIAVSSPSIELLVRSRPLLPLFLSPLLFLVTRFLTFALGNREFWTRFVIFSRFKKYILKCMYGATKRHLNLPSFLEGRSSTSRSLHAASP